MFVYILLYVSICVFANIYSRKTVVKTFRGYKDIDCISISFIIMVLFLGLRNDIGLDDGMYLRTFQEIHSDGSSWRDIEASYTWISKIVQSVGGTVQLVFLIYAIITCFFLYLSIKKLVKNENRWIFFGIFLSFMFLSSITLMRQFAAGSLVLYGYCNWRENKRKKSIVILFMAGESCRSNSCTFKILLCEVLFAYIITLFFGSYWYYRNLLFSAIYLYDVCLQKCQN